MQAQPTGTFMHDMSHELWGGEDWIMSEHTAGPWRLEGPSPNNIHRIKDGSGKTLVLTELSDDMRRADLSLMAEGR